MNSTSIEWTDATWNPVTGCTEVSPGCDHCYARTFANRWLGIRGHPYEQGFAVTLRPERLDEPLRWKHPRRVFVNSMSDLFHIAVPEPFIRHVFATMAAAPQHQFQVLTKRADRMERVVGRLDVPHNVWLGVSVETPAYYSRIRHLQRTEAPVRFLSCEPLIAALDDLPLDNIDWVIVGGESGPGARPMRAAWVRSIRGQCRAAGIAFFFKQWGGVQKKRNGRLLDGRTWDAMPTPRPHTAPPPAPAIGLPPWTSPRHHARQPVESFAEC